jgi:hypothetical protein
MLAYNVFYEGMQVTVNVQPKTYRKTAKIDIHEISLRDLQSRSPEIARNIRMFRAIDPADLRYHLPLWSWS